MISRKVFSLPVGSVPISRNLNKKLVVSSETNLGVRGRRVDCIGGIGGIGSGTTVSEFSAYREAP